MKYSCHSIVVGIFIFLSITVQSRIENNACEPVLNFGYPCEIHNVETEDGYILSNVRIPSPSGRGYPVFLQHGLLDTSDTWLMNYYEHQNLALILNKAGYDVWLGNSRGNVYSSNHTLLSTNDPMFWDGIDMDFMAMYDLPANIDHTLTTSGHQSLTWIGHSQGTWQAFSAFSTVRKEYTDRVDLFIALAPVTKIYSQESFLISTLLFFRIDDLFLKFGDRDFLPSSSFLHHLSALCTLQGNLCANSLAMLCGGADPKNVNSTQIYQMTNYSPGGTSVRNMAHWAQLGRHDRYSMYDYGSENLNMEHYNSPAPPLYNLSNYTEPKLVLVSSEKDKLADPDDVSYITDQIMPNVTVASIQLQEYGHMDFVWGLDAHEKIYPSVLEWIKNITKKYN